VILKGAAPVAAFHRPQDRRAVRAADGHGSDESDDGLARGFAFRLVEGLASCPRAEIADDIKALDQDARGLLRKHGVRFGQFTIFMPLLLKPAPTRLRLVLWGWRRGSTRFPKARRRAGDDPARDGDARGLLHDVRLPPAGSRAIRIDMLERLADMLRGQDTPRRVRGDGGHAVDHRHDAGAVRRPDGRAGLQGRARRALLGDAPPTGWKGPTRPIRHHRRCRLSRRPRHRIRRRRKRPPIHRPRHRRDAPTEVPATRRPRPARRRSPRPRSSTPSPGRRDVVAAMAAAASHRGRRRQAPWREAEGRRQAARQGWQAPVAGRQGPPGRAQDLFRETRQTREGRSRQPLRRAGRTQGQVLNEQRPRLTGSTGGCGMRGSSRRARSRRVSSAEAVCA
jgi:hypothetical protein